MIVEIALYLAGFALVLLGSIVAAWSYLMNDRSKKMQMKTPVAVLLVSMWALSGGTSLAMIDQQIAGNWVSLINTALLTLGTTAIVLTQRYHAARREETAAAAADLLARGLVATRASTEQTAKELTAGLSLNRAQTITEGSDLRDRIAELHDRLNAVIAQRDRISRQNDQLLARLLQLGGPAAGSSDTVPPDPLPGVPPS